MCVHFRCLLEDALKHVPPNLLSLPPLCTPQNFPSEVVSPIFPILSQHPLSLAAHLVRFGYACRGLPYPVVPRGQERIRVIVHAASQPEELKELVSRILEWAETMQVQNIQPGSQFPELRSRM